MNREELAKELGVRPWDVDDWLLWGCPAREIRMRWDFDIEKVIAWLKMENIRMKCVKSHRLSASTSLDEGWFGKRCPICMSRGFTGGKAGRLYSLGERLGDDWHLRRVGIPCGHSQDLSKLRGQMGAVDAPKR